MRRMLEALPQCFRQLPEGTKEGADFECRRIAQHRTAVDSRQVDEVLYHHRNIRHIFPDEEILIFADRVFYEILPEFGLASASMLMNDSASRCEKTLPSTLPRLIRQIGVFHIERMVKRIESAHREILFSVARARTAAGP